MPPAIGIFLFQIAYMIALFKCRVADKVQRKIAQETHKAQMDLLEEYRQDVNTLKQESINERFGISFGSQRN